MDQGKMEALIRDIIAQEAGRSTNQQSGGPRANLDDSNTSPLLRDLRDSVLEKIKGESSDVDNSPLLEGIKQDVENSIG
ncbi:hypothetical protein [Levilactobacillus koreensis]|uniref:Uncharacterized protein n=1 Tax=Levilactobacillus koreensis TaxID=637971 RepID=A0AAC8UX47_9LACO|nr:hypothetical protein [Levilactobacillus koreensis]AKP65394.1 hypothetical protein ABN16_10535 [Levilactobacillus koreensis]